MLRMLEGLGVQRDVEKVYLFVLGEDRWNLSLAADRLGMTQEAVRSALAQLSELNLLEADEDHAGGLRLVDPRVALDALVHARRAELTAGQQRLQRSRAAVERLLEEFEDCRPRRGGSGTERIPGQQAAVERIAALTREVRFEVMAFHPGFPADFSFREGRDNEAVLRRNGVTSRTVREFSQLAHPPTLEYIQDLTARGDRIRFVDRVPVRMIILDRETAFVPLDPDDSSDSKGALQTTDRGTVAALHALFERFWEIAAELPDLRAQPRPSVLTHVEQEVLRLLAKGLTDETVARQLDLSVRTVRRIVKDLMDRLGARSRFELGFRAAEQGWPN